MNARGKVLTVADRQRLLADRKQRKMGRSPEDFVRGTSDHFYAWLASAEGRRLPEGPPIWICGDCHHGNIGPVASRGGRVELDGHKRPALMDIKGAVAAAAPTVSTKPAWLWTSAVALLGIYDVAYLDHCRQAERWSIR